MRNNLFLMHNPGLYALIFGIPGILVSAFGALFASGIAAGFFWIFVFGDKEWPFWAEWVITIIGAFVFIFMLSTIVKIGFIVGEKLEAKNIPIAKKHILISIVVFLSSIFSMLIFQRGYLFNEPSDQICLDLCFQKGFDVTITRLGPEVSGKRVCSCWNRETKSYDNVGNIVSKRSFLK